MATFDKIIIDNVQYDLPPQQTVNDGILTIKKNGTNIATFKANQSSNVTANIAVPTPTFLQGSQNQDVACTDQLWKRLGYVTIPANKLAIVNATVKHSLVNLGAVITLGTVDANDNLSSMSLSPENYSFDFHRGNLTFLLQTGNASQNVYCNCILLGKSGTVKLVNMTAIYV